MSDEIGIGTRIRPYGATNLGSGAIGCFAKDDSGTIFLITCDHVIKSRSVPEEGPWNIFFPFNYPFKEKIAVFEGKSLITKQKAIADIAAARMVFDVPNPSLLPQPIPASGVKQILGIAEPLPDVEVLLWGARTKEYHPGVILFSLTKHAWPHRKYGSVTYEEQFSVAIKPDFKPKIGDSGGCVITTEGNLVGLLAALSETSTDAGNAIIYCVPIKNCLQILNLQVFL